MYMCEKNYGPAKGGGASPSAPLKYATGACIDKHLAINGVLTIVGVYKQYQCDWLVEIEYREEDVWKSTIMASGELCAMTISTTMTPKLHATCSDSGMFEVLLYVK